MIHETEVHAYAHILQELKNKKGWRKDQIFTQNEIQRIPEIKRNIGLKTPENIVMVKEKEYYVIESKSRRSMLDTAISKAKEYADKINQSKFIQAPFITGISGNEDEGYVAVSKFLHNGNWETITENGADVTGLLSKIECEKILETNNPNLEDVEISEEEFLASAEEINDLLHENAIHKDTRAKFIAAILLALSKRVEIDLNQDPVELVNTINTRVDLVLKKENKEEFSRFIHLDMPSSEDNHVKLKNAIVKSIQILLELNIRSAMQSGKDVLGKFYEVFLKYGNGAKEIGIVLTPRHITRFAAESMNISENDLVLDPTCGTGGFLVAVFDAVKKKKTKRFDNFKKYGLYGIEEQDAIIVLALVNMIFRGDGKNNMIEGNCFTKWLETKTIDGVSVAKYKNIDNKNRLPPITKVLMNPPFPKKKTDKKEFLFVDHALKQMHDDGLLFSILPYSCMIKEGIWKNWRKNILKTNTLLSVITFPPELFYPVGVRTVGVFMQKGTPHKNKKILWLRCLHDGFVKKKGKRLIAANEPDQIKQIKYLMQNYLSQTKEINIDSVPAFQKHAPINYNDDDLELVPEVYLDEPPFEIQEIVEIIEQSIRGNIAVSIKFEEKLGKDQTLFDLFNVDSDFDRKQVKNKSVNYSKIQTRKFTFTDIFIAERGNFHSIDKLEFGKYPTISRVSNDNGIVGFYEKPETAKIFEPGHLTISTVTGDAFLQHYPFIATDNVVICVPKHTLRKTTLVYIQAVINKIKWRYSYGRQPYKRILQKAEFYLPVNPKNEIDEDIIEKIVTKIPYWAILDKLL